MNSKNPKNKKVQYPLATIALYGPNDKITIKVAIGIFRTEKDKSPVLLRRWVSSNFPNDEKAEREILEFLREQNVKQTVMTAGNLGCPHEEGMDFPIGEDYPFCPFWKGRQGSKRRKL